MLLFAAAKLRRFFLICKRLRVFFVLQHTIFTKLANARRTAMPQADLQTPP